MGEFQRYNQIVQLLEKRKELSIEELSKLLYASPSTVRRDLTALEKEGVLKRVRGGAVFLKSNATDLPAYIRTAKCLQEKETIADIALRFVENRTTYFFDSSSTCCVLAQKLNPHLHGIIATNGIDTISTLQDRENVQVISTGGEVRMNYAELTGHITLCTIRQLHADTFFFSCSGISAAGPTEANEANMAVKMLFHQHARRSILLCDSSKFGLEFFYYSVPFSEIDFVITDKKPQNPRLLELLDGKLLFPET